MKTEDTSKLSLKERLALRATQGKIDQYLNVISKGSKDNPINLTEKSSNIDLKTSTEDYLDDLLGNKRRSEIDLETPTKKSETKNSKNNDSSSQRPKRAVRNNSNKKKIVDDDDDDDEEFEI